MKVAVVVDSITRLAYNAIHRARDPAHRVSVNGRVACTAGEQQPAIDELIATLTDARDRLVAQGAKVIFVTLGNDTPDAEAHRITAQINTWIRTHDHYVDWDAETRARIAGPDTPLLPDMIHPSIPAGVDLSASMIAQAVAAQRPTGVGTSTISNTQQHPRRDPNVTEPAPTVTGDEVVITRVFDAPRELVFRCMVTPEHLTHFWGPKGTSTPVSGITIDLRPGGVFETTMVNDADGTEFPNRGIFVEIVEPEPLSWTEPDFGMTTTPTFTELGDGRTCRLTRTPRRARAAVKAMARRRGPLRTSRRWRRRTGSRSPTGRRSSGPTRGSSTWSS